MQAHPHALDQHILFNDAFLQDPYAAYRELRADGPVVRLHNAHTFAILGHDEAQTALKDAQRFSSNRLEVARKRINAPHLKPLLDTLCQLMLQRDDPDHRRLQRLVHHAFQRTAVAHYESRIRELASDLLANAVRTGRMEFVADFAVPLPILVISEIVGIPPEDRAAVKRWCDAFSMVALNFYGSISDDALEAGCAAVMEFETYLEKRIEAVKANPDGSLLSALVAAEEDGERLSRDELVANVLLLLNAGNETTSILLTNACHRFVREGLFPSLRADPSLLPAALEEVLRHEAPVQFIGRIVSEPTELGGVALAEGDLVLIMLAAADRDASHAPHPDDFDMTRAPNRHLAFGSGPHMCAGIQLARLEARVAMATFLNTFNAVSITDNGLRHGPNPNLRAFQALPLTLTPVSSTLS